ncbi:Short-chain dehydrogenase [Halomicrobium zhouii]|uniref:Short-chain dehydrogenase n=1 Tax=Halomicrobium zhouii TaxID=767519 RepID=A0A1I6LH04_9EURY|nr:SDR family oxidoreductase [Halomicrobium zhouii]SFS02600.1 Short-chain dehydrogenase [Halomicrobium zhouii]
MAKTVLITGCSSGIGRATALAFLDEEWSVWATARDEDDVANLADKGCQTAELDVTNARDCERVVDRVLDTDGRIDCLVNNAGYGQFGPLEDVSVEELHAQFDVNVYGPHRLVREALPHMRERGDGTIVNVSSVSGRIATPGNGAYSGSKFALEAMSDSLRAEVDGFGVDVVVVEPGPVDTGFDDRFETELEDVDHTPEYDWLYEMYDDASLVGGGGTLSIPPRAVALTIRDAAYASDPEPRYPVGEFAKIALMTRFLPGTYRDFAFRLLQKLV